MILRRLSKFVALGCSLLSLAAVMQAQPSGGPYGPIQQTYELPQAKRIYYVAPTGQADATGLKLSQPTTIETAISKVKTGDAIILRGGTYRSGNLRLSQGITMQPYADERPVFKGTEIADNWTALPNGLWQTSWTRLFPSEPADWWRNDRNVARTPLHLFNNDMVFVDGKLLATVGKAENVNKDTYVIDYENGLVTIGVDPTDRIVEITTHNSAILRTMREAHGKKNDRIGPTFRGITFTQYARLALEVEGIEPGKLMDPSKFGKEVVGTTFENLTISFCSRVAGYFRGDKLTIRNCLISDTGTEGIYVINSSDALLEKNIIRHNNSFEQFRGYFASAVKIFNQTHRVICRDNLIIDNPYSSGIWYDVGNRDGLIVNNWFQNTNDGVFFEISQGAIVAGNVFVDCRPGIRILNAAEVQVYQNTFFNSTARFTRNGRSHTVGDHFGWHTSAGPAVEERHSHVFKNNLLAADETFERPLLRFYQRPDIRERMKDPMVKGLDGNVYTRRTGVEAKPLVRWAPLQNESGFENITDIDKLRELQPDFAANAQTLPDYWGPLFKGTEVGNFELRSEFPASDAGVPLPAHILEALDWDEDQATFPGAYPPQ